MSWSPPDNYKSIRGAESYVLRNDNPQPGSAEDRLRTMITTFATPPDVGLTPGMARELIDRRIVPTGLYPWVLAVAWDHENAKTGNGNKR